jgi:GGDEF domain-containing protein
MTTGKRWFWVGGRNAVREAVAALHGQPPRTGAAIGRGDLVVMESVATNADAQAAGLSGLPGGHAFAAVHAWKAAGADVHVVVDAGDAIGVQLARFCLANAVLTWDPRRGQLDAAELLAQQKPRTKAGLDELLARLEPQLASSRGESSLQRLLRFEREDSIGNRLQDVETGLFDGPYATWKLDEEWKRAHRFHQPLSLLLLDLGPGLQSCGDVDRRALLAEASGVFLNECRDIDVLARFAPTVFLMLLPGTGPDGAEVVANRILAALRQRFAGHPAVRPAGGLGSVPSAEIPDRRAFLAMTEACLRRAEATGAGAVCTTWQ